MFEPSHTGAWVNVQAHSKEAGRRVCQELCTQVAMSRPYNYLNVSSKPAAEALEAICCMGWVETAIDLGDAGRFWFDECVMDIFKVALREGALIINHSTDKTVFDDAFSSMGKRETINAAEYLVERDRIVRLGKLFAEQHPDMVEQVGSDIEIQWPDGAVVGLYEDAGEGGVYTRKLSGPIDAIIYLISGIDRK